eukprot:UC4_evm1s1473
MPFFGLALISAMPRPISESAKLVMEGSRASVVGSAGPTPSPMMLRRMALSPSEMKRRMRDGKLRHDIYKNRGAVIAGVRMEL